MSLRDWVLFVGTFVIALLCGMWLYFTTFVPTYVANTVMQSLIEETAPEWEISLRLYGGCAMSQSCPAAAVDSRGRVEYQPTAQQPIESQTLPRPLRERYEALLVPGELAQLAAPSAQTGCRSYVDGIDYTISIRAAGENYELDTCRTALNYNSVWTTLIDDTIVYLDNPGQYRPPNQHERGGLGGIIERQLQETFDYDEQ